MAEMCGKFLKYGGNTHPFGSPFQFICQFLSVCDFTEIATF